MATDIMVRYNSGPGPVEARVSLTIARDGRTAEFEVRSDAWLGYGYTQRDKTIAAAAVIAMGRLPMVEHTGDVHRLSGFSSRGIARYSTRRSYNYQHLWYGALNIRADMFDTSRLCNCGLPNAPAKIISSVLTGDENGPVHIEVISGRYTGRVRTIGRVASDFTDYSIRTNAGTASSNAGRGFTHTFTPTFVRPVPLRTINGGVVEEALPGATVGTGVAGCECGSCKCSRGDIDHNLFYGEVWNYSYRPAWEMRRADSQNRFDSSLIYLGVELETTRTPRAALTNELAVSTARPADLWFAKRDASVSGPEFVSHPATLEYWKSKRDEIAEMFKMLVHGGFRSHDGNEAGLHVNISKNAFEGSAHLARFLNIIYYSAGWSLVMSQRQHNEMSHWARIPEVASASAYEQALMDDATEPYHNILPSTRYKALNNPDGEKRFEFRLPRGTLRVDRFFKTLEWVVGMIEYARTHTLSESTPALFMEWVDKDVYPDLYAFLVEKKDILDKVKEDRGF